MEEIRGTITETLFRNEENGYTVLQIRAGRENVGVVGVMPEIAAGEQAVFQGEWVMHPQYGKQFKAAQCEILKPSTLLGVERYLSSGLIRGVGPATAKLIVQEFGVKALDIISEQPHRLTEIAGIGTKRAAQIADSFREQYAVRQAMVFLQSYGVSPALAVKISKVYGDRVKEIILANPYRLVEDVDGVGFLTADRIALSMGIATESEGRLRAGLIYALQEAAVSSGHTYLPLSELMQRAGQLLRVEKSLLETHISALLLSRKLRSHIMEDGTEGIFLPQMWQAETEIARRLHEQLGAAQVVMRATVAAQITAYENANGISFSPTQRQAISMAVQEGLLVITGGPGTGKTTIINCILSLLDSESVCLAAPTGRAAKRMSEATGKEASTLHRLLEYGGDEGEFIRDEENPLDCTCLIVDEMSMVDVFLMRALLRALPVGARLILVGDADQLPSVGAGNVLGDILQSSVIPSVRLTEIFRQAESSLIVRNAHAINHGEMPQVNLKGSNFFLERKPYAESAAQTIVDLCKTRLPNFLNSGDPIRQIQVLAPTKKGACGVNALNCMLQAALNPPSPEKEEIAYGDGVFRTGDKVMHIKNNYNLEWEDEKGHEGQGVFNGDMGTVLLVDNDDKTLSVLFDDGRMAEYEYGMLEELELAYCLSVHKSQGSEFRAVVMPAVGGPPMLLTRNLFYTALTRARELVVLVGREDAIAAMVNNNHIARRYTGLCQRLQEIPKVRL
ncbi:MAG: ATP-dependent RecD-like DNA helicase [Clostridia bacterium]|nr:ATP-dependent RecD-like DNA helicase [Clostridia bacterium]